MANTTAGPFSATSAAAALAPPPAATYRLRGLPRYPRISFAAAPTPSIF
ncbi:hypothetical protein OROMI_016094 [Orobanche minor]